MDRRVVITGMGAISCVGNNVTEFWNAVVNGECGIDTVDQDHMDITRYKTKIAGQVKDFDITAYMHTKEARRLAPFSQFAIAAADEAVENAGLERDLSNVNQERVGVVVSSGIGGIQTIEEQHKVLLERGPEKVTPFLVPMMIADLEIVSPFFFLYSPFSITSTTCAIFLCYIL